MQIHFKKIRDRRPIGAGGKSLTRHKAALSLVVLVVFIAGIASAPGGRQKTAARVLNAGFVCVDGVFNSELMAPYDVLQHTYYRDSLNYIRCFIITPDGKPFRTAEGITVTPDYAMETAPGIDILVIPSSETSMDADLRNQKLIDFIARSVKSAAYVITVCDGAFPLAQTGALNGRTATTFPADRERLAKMFPQIDVRSDVNFAVDGKFITSVGGALSYQPALYLVEKLYSAEHARRTARGLVLVWDLSRIPPCFF